MEQQTENIRQTQEVPKNFLSSIFNPAHFGVAYPLEPHEVDILDEKKKQFEIDTYENVVWGLESDLIALGADITYSAKIIIGEVAMNMVFLQRVKSGFICQDLMRNKQTIKPTDIFYRQDHMSSTKRSKSIVYDWIPINSEEIHPVIEKLLPQLQKQINDGLKTLGLLPSQTIERQKLIIVKRLREKYTNLTGSEITIEAKAEKRL